MVLISVSSIRGNSGISILTFALEAAVMMRESTAVHAIANATALEGTAIVEAIRQTVARVEFRDIQFYGKILSGVSNWWCVFAIQLSHN